MADARPARHVRFRATAGDGDELAAMLTAVADDLRAVQGCELYMVAQTRADPDEVWVTELWSDVAAMQGALEAHGGRERIARVMARCAGPPELIELVPRGGVGVRP